MKGSTKRRVAGAILLSAAVCLVIGTAGASGHAARTAAHSSRAASCSGKSLHFVYANPTTPSDPTGSTIDAGFKAADQDFCANTTWSGPSTGTTFSVVDETRNIQNAAATKPDGMIIYATSGASNPAIAAVVKSGIPVVQINGRQVTSVPTNSLTYAGNNEPETGTVAGQQLVQLGVHDVLCVTLQPGLFPVVDARCNNMFKVVGAHHIKYTRVVANINDTLQARNTIEAALSKDPKVDAIFSISTLYMPSIIAAVNSLSSARKAQIKLASVDTNLKQLNWVKDGTLKFAISQQGYLQGFYAVQVLAQYIRDGVHPIVPQIWTGPLVVNKSNIDQLLKACDTQKAC